MKITMLHMLLLSLIFSLLAAANAFAYTSYIYNDCVRGNNKIDTTEREVTKFDILDINGAFEVRVVAGKNENKVKITADSNLLPHLTTSTQGNRLAIYPAKPICTENEILIEISATSVEGLISSGSDNVKISDINSQSFSIVQGGSGDIELHGSTHRFDAELSGAGDLIAQFLKSKVATLQLKGSSNVNVYASDELNVSITGVADVNYFGNPKKITKDIIGVGNLVKMD